jgi:carnitine O-acetyltransferase
LSPFAKHTDAALCQHPLPHDYFDSLAPLRYRTPDFSRELLAATVAELRRHRGRRRLKVVDLACGYGVNSALLKHGVDFAGFAHLYRRPAGPEGALARDRDHFAARPVDRELTVVGVDTSTAATGYGLATGLLDAVVSTDLEHTEPTEADREALADADLVLATGGVATLSRVLALQATPPAVLGWPLYGQSTEELVRCLAAHRLSVSRHDTTPRHQRHFASPHEREAYHYTLRSQRLQVAGSAAERSLCVTPLLAMPHR